MKDLNTNKNKHLTLDDRLTIQNGLDMGMTYKAIAKRVGKDQTTVSKEVKKHLTLNDTNITFKDKDGNAINKHCPEILSAPFVCNPCKKRHTRCGYNKQLYIAKKAQDEYLVILKDSRTGIPLSKPEFYEMDRVITDGINKGQHLYHILQTNNTPVSKSTVYRHLKRGYLSVAAIDFPRVVKFKPRKPRYQPYVPHSAKIGRTYTDFLSHLDFNDIRSWWEMYTIIGKIGGKVIMTLHSHSCNFMFGILLDNKSASEVVTKLNLLKKALYDRGFSFSSVFPVILTDNGSEFSDISDIENDIYHNSNSKLFFCDSNSAYQKPNVEKNHTLVRDILKSGNSFDGFSQA